MKKLMSICLLLFIGLCSISSLANDLVDDLVWETVYFPAYKGYIVSYERPSDWKDYGQNIILKKPYTYEDGKQQMLFSNTFTSHIEEMKALNKKIGFTPPWSYDGEMDFRVSQYHLLRPIKFANWVKQEKDFWKHVAMNVYKEGFVDIEGKKSFYCESSGLTTWKSIDEEVAADNPTHKNVIILYNDDILIEVRYGVRYFNEQFKALKPVFERMLNSLRVTPIEKLAAKEVPELYVTPIVLIALGRYGYNVGFSFTLPLGWSAELIEVRHAIPAEPRGRLEVKISPKEGNKDASFLLIAEALPPKINGLIETGDILIKNLINDIEPGSGKQTKTLNRSICLGHAYNLIFRSGGSIIKYRTFQGKDNDGHSVKARIYTGGNRQAACNFVYINNPADYEKLLPTIEKIYKSINSIDGMGK